MQDIKQTVKFLIEAGIWVLVLGVGAIAGLSIWSGNQLVKAKPWIVQSGSMEPTIMTGDIIIAVPQKQYQSKQIVTFRDDAGRVITHRILSNVGSQTNPRFITKGDANRTEDISQISNQQIIGRVIFTLPKMGYLVAYSRTPTGLILMVVVPATIVITDEIRKMAKKGRGS